MTALPHLDPAHRSAIWGVSGSGKSTVALKLAEMWACRRAVVVIDPTGDDARALPAGFTARPALTMVAPPTPDACLSTLMQCYLLSTKARPVTVFCDEAPFYLRKLSDATLKVFNQGRHRGLGVVIVGQRPSAVAPDARANCTRTVYLQLTDRADLNIVAAHSKELADALPRLGTGQFRMWPAL